MKRCYNSEKVTIVCLAKISIWSANMRNYIRNLSVFNKTVLFSTLIVIIVGVGTASVSYYLQNVTTKQLLTQNALTTTKLWKETLSPNEITQFVKAEDLPSSLARTGIEKQFERIYKASPEYLQGHLFTVEPYENHGFKIVVTANQKVRQQLKPSMIYYGEKEFYTHFMKANTEKTEAVTDTYTDQFGTWITAFSPILNEKGEVIAMLVIDDNQKLTKAEIGYIHLMISEMDRAEVIINDYLSLARPGVKEVDIIDCILSVTSLVDLLSSYALLTSNIEIEIQTNQLAYVRGNKNEFNQVLLNIMKNGIEAMQDGGKLSVSINVKDNQVHIAIKDTGEGMTQQELERLGTAFYSLKEKGTGIGLMVSYQIVEEMRGKITVESEKGKGSTFIVSIPAYKT